LRGGFSPPFKEIIMDHNLLGSMALTFIEAFYPGGAESFTEQGGIISSVPFDGNSLLLYLPNMPSAFRESITKHNAHSEVKFVIVKDFNFPNMDVMESIKLLYKVGEEICMEYDIPTILYNPLNPLCLIILIPFSRLSHEEIQQIADKFSSCVPGILRGCLSVGQEHFPFSSSDLLADVYEVISSNRVVMEPDRADITDDAITNLKIDLASVTCVEDFLRDF
jgi:hypothetical protein